MTDFDVQHRDCFESLAAMRDAGGVDLILTSPPYPDARTDEAYGASFDTSLAGYHRLGLAVYEALKPGGVCVLNIDGPVRKWRKTNKRGEEVGSERSLIAYRVAIDWADEIGFRFVEHCAYVRWGAPIGHDNNIGPSPRRQTSCPKRGLRAPRAPVACHIGAVQRDVHFLRARRGLRPETTCSATRPRAVWSATPSWARARSPSPATATAGASSAATSVSARPTMASRAGDAGRTS